MTFTDDGHSFVQQVASTGDHLPMHLLEAKMSKFMWGQIMTYRKPFLFVGLILLLGIVTIVAIPRTSFADAERQLMPESPATDHWQTYEDSDYGFTLEYPANWGIMTLIEQPQPYPEPEKIVRKYAFTGPEGYVTLSVFLTQGLELPVWLGNQNEISPDIFPNMEANARVAEYPAVAFVTGDNLIVFASNDEYVYRFWHPVTDSTPALQANWHILDTFRTLAENVADNSTFIPQSVIDEVQHVVETVENHTIQNIECPNGSGVQEQGCCEIPHLQACYRFPCSVRDGQHRGNCTYYVCYRYGGVPFTGNAGAWWGQVPTTPGWYSYSSPPNGTSIAWFNYGHVAYINSYWGGGPPTFQEQSWCSNRDWPNEKCTTERQDWAHGYIQKGPQPMVSSPSEQ
jgi:hypothetical protein